MRLRLSEGGSEEARVVGGEKQVEPAVKHELSAESSLRSFDRRSAGFDFLCLCGGAVSV